MKEENYERDRATLVGGGRQEEEEEERGLFKGNVVNEEEEGKLLFIEGYSTASSAWTHQRMRPSPLLPWRLPSTFSAMEPHRALRESSAALDHLARFDAESDSKFDFFLNLNSHVSVRMAKSNRLASAFARKK